MKFRPHAFAVAVLIAFSGGAFAQSAASKANEQRCQTLSQEVQGSFQQAVLARVPKQDPGSFNQEAFDIKGLLSQDVGASFAKLMNMDFSSVIDKIVNKAMSSAMQKGTQTFNNKINGVLQQYGIQGNVQIQGSASTGGVGVQGSYNGSQVGSWSTTTPNGGNNSPYGRPGGKK